MKKPRTRIRRGKEVAIPEKWIGNVTTQKTLRQRKVEAMVVRLKRKKNLRTESEFDFKQSCQFTENFS
jgi:hypothetical protein